MLHSTPLGCPHSGYICISLPGERLEALSIPMMVPQNEERHRTAYTVTVDYKHGMCAPFPPVFYDNECAYTHRHDDRNLSARPRPNSPRACRTHIPARSDAARFHSSRAHGPLARATRRRPHAPRTHRSRRRPVCTRRLATRGPTLRTSERRRGWEHDATRRLPCFRR
jgi:hypothetical protein